MRNATAVAFVLMRIVPHHNSFAAAGWYDWHDVFCAIAVRTLATSVHVLLEINENVTHAVALGATMCAQCVTPMIGKLLSSNHPLFVSLPQVVMPTPKATHTRTALSGNVCSTFFHSIFATF